MPENPLLPHRKLRELHALMVNLRALEKKQRGGAFREAVLAATSMQLLAGDVLCPEPGDATAATLAPPTRTRAGVPLLADGLFTNHPQRLALAAAIAMGLQSAATDEIATGLVLAFATAGIPEPDWAAALTAAQTAQIPLILVVEDGTGGRQPRAARAAAAKEPAMLWSTLSPMARRLKLPVLTVDGEDAVAVYRVMQESVIRARFNGGPAILWAVTTPPGAGKLARSLHPLVRLEQYCNARGIRL